MLCYYIFLMRNPNLSITLCYITTKILKLFNIYVLHIQIYKQNIYRFSYQLLQYATCRYDSVLIFFFFYFSRYHDGKYLIIMHNKILNDSLLFFITLIIYKKKSA